MKPDSKIRILAVVLVVMVLLTTIVACQGGSQPAPPPGGNQPPTAEIISISPSQPHIGEEVLLTGQGKDKDGQIVGYEWRSSIDGPLGEFTSTVVSSLSEGDHTIYFSVQDDSGEWSAEVSAGLTILAQAQEVTLEQAAVKVIEDVLEPLNLSSPTIGFKLDETLKPGDTVAPHGGQGQQIDNESYFLLH